ncbi:ATP-dependent helicase HrpB [Pseudarthrobacter cellobiosi]|uniref:ATP-dependent helicase HrpB n=1 Tax=Pseudarthrobacter cellobiosi TaxID=2953654 RepID=UPI00208FE8AF|nr:MULTISPECIES: ATP-dependent helicase HrpB [unclassified Pseudarthrobacter]MCO4254201.1 ATP-dependent helicase HrpB [Pseudarthrobacter sp. HLT1-5]MCO4275853.1 ATP-dependent helicase HrpB [Pseudarthrobacter sp. HLT3-5]
MTSPTNSAAVPAGTPGAATFDLAAIGTGLAFAASLGELASVLLAGGAAGTAVVQAPPGTGKTTLVPPLLANLTGRTTEARRVVVTQPRRVAARAAARRLAALDSSRIGDRVGYTVRGERQAGPATLVEFVTPGILLRRLLDDPGLESTGAVILDEVHERGLETDLLLGMLTEVRQLRGDLTVVAMSATLDAPRFAALIGGAAGNAGTADDGGGPAPVVDCPSALYPLAVEWVPAAVPRLDDRGVTRGFLDHVADTAAQAHTAAVAQDAGTDALVFVPGAWEVSYVAARLRGRTAPGTDVLELHGQVSPAEQDQAVSGRRPGGPARIIVSTDLAESSLTVPGVRLVIDSGLTREPRRDASRGMSGLVTVSCSRASAEQRAGRAARQGPGRVVRCYDQRTYGAAPAHVTPEIVVADLTGAALVLACWGSPGGAGLALSDAPPAAAMGEAVEVLRELGAVGRDGHATALGRTLARVPADPRLARALLDGAAAVGHRAAAEAVALVAGDQRAPGADLTRLLTVLRTGKDPAARRWAEDVRRLETIARKEGAAVGPSAIASLVSTEPVTAAEAVGVVVALAFPDRVGRRVPGDGPARYLLSSGTRAGLPAGSPLTGHEWLAVAEVSRAAGRDAAGTGAVIRSAAPLSADTAEAAAGHLLTDTVEAQFGQGRVKARRERRLGAISLSSTPVRPSAEDGRAAVARALAKEGLGTIGWSTAADALRCRLALLRRELGEPWPDVSEPALLARLDSWLGPELEALAGGAATNSIDLTDPLRRLLPWPEAVRLAELAPEALKVPSGSMVRIDYPEVSDKAASGGAGSDGAATDQAGAGQEAPRQPRADDGGRPVVAVKLQECFGWAETPRLVDGRVPVLFHLLSPARRPLAVTDDLASFWSGPYAQVRSEMRGRYPRHPWPEDPWTAQPTARTKARM